MTKASMGGPPPEEGAEPPVYETGIVEAPEDATMPFGRRRKRTPPPPAGGAPDDQAATRPDDTPAGE